MNKAKKVMHLYMGAVVEFQETYVLNHEPYEAYEKGHRVRLNAAWLSFIQGTKGVKVKLILRPLSSLTKKECLDLCDEMGVSPHLQFVAWEEIKKALYYDEIEFKKTLKGWVLNPFTMFQVTRYLLSKGFDLFDLLPCKQAITKAEAMDFISANNA